MSSNVPIVSVEHVTHELVLTLGSSGGAQVMWIHLAHSRSWSIVALQETELYCLLCPDQVPANQSKMLVNHIDKMILSIGIKESEVC